MRISIIHSLSEARSVLPGYTKHLADGREMHTMLCNIKNRTGIFPVLFAALKLSQEVIS